MDPLQKEIEHWKEQYRHARAEKESMLAQLDEARFLLDIKDEHIALLEKKAQLATELQSRLAGNDIETESLQHQLGEREKKLEKTRQIKNELEDELVASVGMEKDYLTLKDTHTHTSNELQMLQTELRELMDLNKELLKELEKMGQVQMQLELALQENHELRLKMDR